MNTHTSANETDNSESFKRVDEKIRDTPLWIRGDESQGYYITMGDFRLTGNHPTKDIPETMIMERDWNLILAIAAAAAQKTIMMEDEYRKAQHGTYKTTKEGSEHIPDEG